MGGTGAGLTSRDDKVSPCLRGYLRGRQFVNSKPALRPRNGSCPKDSHPAVLSPEGVTTANPVLSPRRVALPGSLADGLRDRLVIRKRESVAGVVRERATACR
jgi:hypothetical protein